MTDSEARRSQVQARALGDPTRHRIFRRVADADHLVGVAELAEWLQLNHNAVRQHLSVLKDADLLLEESEERHRPGRPRLLYRISPDVGGSWGPEGPYGTLAALLSESVRTRRSPRDVGHRAGRRRARELTATTATGDAAGLLAEDLESRGFHPTRIPRARGGCDFVLGRCPFVEVAAADPDTVCQVHLGMVQGLVADLDGDAEVRLVPKSPRRAGCRVTVRVPVRVAGRSRGAPG